MKKILVTGGAGYIGSHTVVELVQKGYCPVIYDDFSSSSPEVINRIQKLTGKLIRVIEGDIREEQKLADLMKSEHFESVIHFAGKKSVSESEYNPYLYFSVNVSGTISLLNAMKKAAVNKIVFSSSATVYRARATSGMVETDELEPINNYGRTKQIGEMLISEVARLQENFGAVILRYFNPVGAHPTGLIGEDPLSIPNNLMPYITQVAAGVRDKLHVFGNDYPTRDGTGSRDFLHVVDLAHAHVKALEYLNHHTGASVFNLGTGQDTTVLELVKAFEDVNEIQIPYDIKDRRKGDCATCFADPSKAKKELGWEAKLNIKDMCKDAWNWQKNNPMGYSRLSS